MIFIAFLPTNSNEKLYTAYLWAEKAYNENVAHVHFRSQSEIFARSFKLINVIFHVDFPSKIVLYKFYYNFKDNATAFYKIIYNSVG